MDGFHGVSLEYLKSRKFLQADGGWDRVVWVPAEILDRIAPFLPEGVRERTANEQDAGTIEELRAFLEQHDHPVVGRWMEEVPAARPLATVGSLPLEVGGYRVILKNARIYADRVIILREEPGPTGRGP